MLLPPLLWIGGMIFLVAFVVMLVILLKKRETLKEQKRKKLITIFLLSAGVALAVTLGINAIFYGWFGVPYPGESLDSSLKLAIVIGGGILILDGLDRAWDFFEHSVLEKEDSEKEVTSKESTTRKETPKKGPFRFIGKPMPFKVIPKQDSPKESYRSPHAEPKEISHSEFSKADYAARATDILNTELIRRGWDIVGDVAGTTVHQVKDYPDHVEVHGSVAERDGTFHGFVVSISKGGEAKYVSITD